MPPHELLRAGRRHAGGPRLPLLVPLLAAAVAACGGAESPSALCDGAALEPASALPLDSVSMLGVPASMGDSLVAEVRPGGDGPESFTPALRREGGRVRITVPVHPTWSREGGPVELVVTNGEVSCAPRTLEIEPLPAAPGAAREVAERTAETLGDQAAALGADLETLREAPPDSLAPPLLPLAVAARLLDRADSLRSDADTTRVAATLDALVARSRADEMLDSLDRRTRALRRGLDSLDAAERREVARWRPAPDGTEKATARRAPTSGDPRARRRARAGPRSTRARAAPAVRKGPARRVGPRPVLASFASTGRPAPDPPVRRPAPHARPAALQDPERQEVVEHVRGFDQVTCEGPGLPAVDYPDAMRDLSAAELDRYMTASAHGAIGTMPGVVEYLENAQTVLGVGAALHEGLATYTGDKALSRTIGRTFAASALSLEALKLRLEAYANLLPRDFVAGSFGIDLAPRVLAEDDPGPATWERMWVSARSRGWRLDETVLSTLIEMLPAEFDKLLGDTPDAAVQMANQAISQVMGEMKAQASAAVTDGSDGGSEIFCVRGQTFGPVHIGEPYWSVVDVLRGGAFVRVDRHTYRPVAVGTSVLRAHTAPDRFGGGPVAGKELTLEVRGIQVRMTPAARRVEPGQTAVVMAEVLHAEDPDVEWTIEQGGGEILRRSEAEPNLHEVVVEVPDPRQGAVIVKATATADRSHLEGHVPERSGAARLHGEPIEMADACTGEVMERTATRTGGIPALMAKASTHDPSKLQRPGVGSMEISGLVSDGGTACTHHVAAYGAGTVFPFMGGQAPGVAGDMAEAMQELQGLAGQVAEEGADAREGDEDARERMMEAIGQGQALAGGDATEDLPTVIQLYSPNGRIWQTGALLSPRSSEHAMLGGWRSNAATLINIQLRDTPPDEVRAGETYDAVAETGSMEEGMKSDAPVVPTVRAFYTWWRGNVVGVPWDAPRARQACEEANASLEKAGVAEHLAQGRIQDCRYAGYAFEGTTRRVTGRLEGTVTIDSIAGERVHGRFDLRGSGELHEERREFTRNQEGQVTGDREVDERTESGPIEVSGTFRAPNHTANLGRIVGMQTVVIPSGASRD